jgi:SAM-dependent methyltransferase
MGSVAQKNLPAIASLTLRDPEGMLVRTEEGRLICFAHARKTPVLEKALRDESLIRRAHLVPSRAIGDKEAKALIKKFAELLPWSEKEVGLVLEHEPVFFPSYPYEWCQPALVKAGVLTLDFAEEALKRGWGIKEATPYNVLFEGTRPVFVDWLTLESRSPTNPTWLAFTQFVRCFLIPVLMENKGRLPLQSSFAAHRDGLTPEEAYGLAPFWRRLTPSFFPLVTVPVLLNRRRKKRGDAFAGYSTIDVPPKRAGFILQRLFSFLKDRLQRLNSAPIRWNKWGYYLLTGRPYEPADWREKKQLLSGWLDNLRPTAVLDLGCNEGRLSVLAAQSGARVVAIDSDREMVRRTWQRAEASKLDVQALLVDICRPSPASGWKNEENLSFLDRARGKFDLVSALSLIHHVCLGEGISYDRFFALIADFTTKYFVVEFVGPQDPAFQWAAKGRATDSWEQGAFLKALQPHFQIVEQSPIPNTDRTLYLLQKRKKK